MRQLTAVRFFLVLFTIASLVGCGGKRSLSAELDEWHSHQRWIANYNAGKRTECLGKKQVLALSDIGDPDCVDPPQSILPVATPGKK